MSTSVPVFDPKAVIEGRAPGRTRIGLIVATVIAVVCGLIVLGIYASESEIRGHSVLPFLVAVPFALLPVPLLIALVLFLDRLEPEPRDTLIFAFLWGAGIAALFAALINTLGLQFVTEPALGKTTGEYVSATFGAPVVEETLKGLVLLGLLRYRRQELDGPTDGIVYAAMVGLGFAMMENVGYYIDALVRPEVGGVKLLGLTFVLRGVLSPLAHPMFTSMTGIGVAYAASHRRAWWAIPLGWAGAMLLHGSWNGLSAFGLDGLGLAYVLLLFVLAGLIIVLVRDRHRIVGLIRRCLPGYIPTGLVTWQDVTMLSTLRGRRIARNWARGTGGMASYKAMADYQLAGTELALLHQRAERGVINPGRFEERRHDLLGLMQTARNAFLSRRPEPPLPPWAPQGHSGFTQPNAVRAPMPPPGLQPWQPPPPAVGWPQGPAPGPQPPGGWAPPGAAPPGAPPGASPGAPSGAAPGAPPGAPSGEAPSQFVPYYSGPHTRRHGPGRHSSGHPRQQPGDGPAEQPPGGDAPGEWRSPPE
jgi:RsiW-degrading membrane proteinase PrsW (M82 family)